MLKYLQQDPVLVETFLNIYSLVLRGKIIPTSTAFVEQCFSLMNSIYTVNRNRLTQETLTTHMQMGREGQDVLTAFQKDVIVNNYKNMKTREIR